MAIFITGCAGFIGANFVLNWLNYYDEKVLIIDKSPYLGNLENLRTIESYPNYEFVKGSIGAQHQKHFLVARNKKDLYENIERLLTDIELINKPSKNARTYIESHHSMSRLYKDVLDAY